MVVYHVTSYKKLLKYIRDGEIKPPVRAWKTIAEAERFSKQTGRVIILRLKFPANAVQLPGHKNQAVYLDLAYPIKMWLLRTTLNDK